jgi:hypothetical protein
MRADVCRNGKGPATQCADIGRRLLKWFAAAAREGDVCAALCQQQGGRSANARAATCYEGHAAAEIKPFKHHHLLRRWQALTR